MSKKPKKPRKTTNNDPAPYVPQPIFGDLESLFIKDKPYKLPVYTKPAGRSSINAQADLDYAIAFLERFKENKNSFASYRADLERFLHWSWHVAELSILDHDEMTLGGYITFFKKPHKSWIGTATVPRFISENGKQQPNPEWRPFVAKLSKSVIAARKDELAKKAAAENFKGKIPATKAKVSDYNPAPTSVKASIRVLSSLYGHLALRKIVSTNYVKLIPQRKILIGEKGRKNKLMKITDDQWQYVIATAMQMAANDDKHERTLFIMSLLYMNYLRISELVHDDMYKPMMSDIYQDNSHRWWLHIVGKGVKDRKVGLSDDMLAALVRYRESRGLLPYPVEDENEPLITVARVRIDDTTGEPDADQALRSTRAVRQLVQQCFDQSYDRMIKDKDLGDKAESMAASLRSATVHWLRHTGISNDVQERDLYHVTKDAGHSDPSTTGGYIEVEDEARHASGKDKKLIPETTR